MSNPNAQIIPSTFTGPSNYSPTSPGFMDHEQSPQPFKNSEKSIHESLSNHHDHDHNHHKDLSDQLGDSHMNILPLKQLIFVLLILCNNVLMAFLDQSAITVALSTLAQELDAEKTINWAATAALLANCVCQGLFGRLSDIFGRKIVLLTSMGLLAIADLCCGFAKTGVQFYVFRAFAGIGNGGIQALTNVLISDVVSLKQRGKFQGILGFNVGVGNAIGPFLMSAFVKHSSWRNFYHMIPAIVVIQMAITGIFVKNPKKPSNSILTKTEKFKKIDYIGMFFSTAGLTLLLVPLNGGGSTYDWDSVLVIVMFIIGGLCFITFLLVEWKIPKLPMIPLNIFKTLLLNLILASNLLYGLVYFSFQYYIPYYFQIVLGHDELKSAILLLPLVICQSVMSTVAGQIISRTGHYKYVILIGYGLWFLGCGLLLIFDVRTNSGTIVAVFLVMGSGVGFTFQPSVVAAQAHAKKSDRAVVISTRNLVRYFGGAMGTAIASLIVSNSLLQEISKAMNHPKRYSNIPTSYLNYLKSHIYNRIEIKGLSESQVEVVQKMYMKAIRNYFYLTIPMLGLCFVSSLFVKDRGLQALDEMIEEEGKKLGEKDI